MSGELDGQVALVTGASSGLGRRFAAVLAEAGAAVAVAGRRLERLEELAKEIEAAGGRALPVQLDVADAGAIPGAVDAVEAGLGPVDILVNNAGIPDAKRAHRMPLEVVDAVLATNVRGPWQLSTEVARRSIAAERPARIVNISSMGAHDYGHGGAAGLYSVSKAAIERMSEVHAVEWAKYRINVNAIAPGAFLTEMMEGMIGRLKTSEQEMAEAWPRHRFPRPELLDSTLLYLCSPASEAVTGTVVKVDDGQHGR
ncbi:SDR family NAD(P)-dependent oxidoreductase [Pseudonocardia pini]|uniref:SDR family NAD(P)-dependent oxidoreductase n=1 Tax=Pseudonocardia pini TaxID=2758030 RepID=UPI0015F08937|nr:SDR family NAD(P)-dependent oxidoreductase [Pseudonocardia pini]